MFEDLIVGPQWRVTLDDVLAIAAAYGWTVPDQAIEPLGGAVNGVARVRTSQGDVSICVHRPWMNGERLDAVHAVQDDLRERGIPIPCVLTTQAGTTWTTLPGQPGQHPRLVEAVEFVASDPGEISRQRSDIAIATLAPLHAVLATISPGSVPEPAYSAFADPPTALAMLDETEPYFRLAIGAPGYAAAVAVRERSRNLLSAMLSHWVGRQPDLPRQLVHGDLQFGNILVRNARIVAVLDFDYMAERSRVFDLAYSLYHDMTRLRRATTSDRLSNTERQMLIDQVSLYSATTHFPPCAAELNALPFEMAAVGLYPVAEAGYLLRDSNLEGAIAQTLSTERHLPLIESLVDESAAISRTLVDRSRT